MTAETGSVVLHCVSKTGRGWQFLGMVEEGKEGCVRSRKPTQQVSRGARMSEMSEMNVKLLATTLESRHVVVLVGAQGTGTDS